jgi:hypothetical protein
MLMTGFYRFSCYVCLAAIMTAGATAYADTFSFQVEGEDYNGSGRELDLDQRRDRDDHRTVAMRYL